MRSFFVLTLLLGFPLIAIGIKALWLKLCSFEEGIRQALHSASVRFSLDSE